MGEEEAGAGFTEAIQRRYAALPSRNTPYSLGFGSENFNMREALMTSEDKAVSFEGKFVGVNIATLNLERMFDNFDYYFKNFSKSFLPSMKQMADRMKQEALYIIRQGGVRGRLQQTKGDPGPYRNKIPKNHGKYDGMKRAGTLSKGPTLGSFRDTSGASYVQVNERSGMRTVHPAQHLVIKSDVPYIHWRYYGKFNIGPMFHPLGYLSGALFHGVNLSPLYVKYSYNSLSINWNITQPPYVQRVHEGHGGAGRGDFQVRALSRPFADVMLYWFFPPLIESVIFSMERVAQQAKTRVNVDKSNFIASVYQYTNEETRRYLASNASMKRFNRTAMLASMQRPGAKFSYVYGQFTEPEKFKEATNEYGMKTGAGSDLTKPRGPGMFKEDERRALLSMRRTHTKTLGRRRPGSGRKAVSRTGTSRLAEQSWARSNIKATKISTPARKTPKGGKSIEQINREVEAKYRKKKKP